MTGTGKTLLYLLLCVFLAACNPPDQTSKTQDIISQRVTPKDRTPVTVLVKYAFSINEFEKKVEELFPHIDLIQVGNYTKDRGIVEYESRLKHDDLPDIVMTWPLDVGKEYWEQRLLDLSSMPFSSRYSTAMLNNIASSDGRLFYLPGPAQVRGIVYNKTLFAEKGWQVPTDFKGFIELCKAIEASGIRALQLGFANAEVLDTAFVGFSYGSCFSTPADAQRLADYNDGRQSFGTHFEPALNTFQFMIDQGIWKKGDLRIGYAKRETMLFTRQCAMIEDSVLMARMGYHLTGTTDEFALMPFFSPSLPSDWARLYMVCYIGLNKRLAEPENKAKFALVLELMDYISTPDGQIALAADTSAMYSSLKNVHPPAIPEIVNLRTTLSLGRFAAFPELKNAQNALRQGLAGVLAGTHTREDVVRMVDEQNLNPPSALPVEVLGNATEDFTMIETGNFVTDAMRARADAQIALFLDNGKDGRFNGKGISARLYKGEQTAKDVFRVLPDLKHGEKGILQVATMTGENLLRTLEHAIAVGNDARGWFYYFSGLRMTYAPAAKPGERIRHITTADGKAISPQAVYTVAVMDGSLPHDAAMAVTDTTISIESLFTEAIRTQGTISPSKDGRFTIAAP